ncbi:hypothetical protein DSO57_1002667 [Entomophthora muscae]|uniref:Uncharacterized protein n=2 Tax=Entomophthora muscae TaxID=34485 RepID=A0ACC2SAK2_9FUNG|nr:hypothetical protein DSO57_1003537 [Entomophthora muscae]KAJ9074823.1 hypothetical protein DSO57_1002667 [Entomophthora muscae]
MTDAQFRKSFMSQHAAVDPRTVPTVPKLLPPLPRISPTNKLHMSDVCLRWSSGSEEAMICVANVYSDDVPRTNPFSGVYINYLYGQAACDAYSNDTQKGIRHSFASNSGSSQVDVGGNVDTLIRHVSKVSAPAVNAATNYIDGIKTGVQSRFLSKYVAAARSGDGIVLAKSAMENMMNLWNNMD